MPATPNPDTPQPAVSIPPAVTRGQKLDDAQEAVIRERLNEMERSMLSRSANADDLEQGTPVRGYDHSAPFSLDRFLEAMGTTGFQATNVARAIAILREVRDRNVPLYLGFTSNIGSCGLRETVTYLTREQHVRALATTAGAVEEDVMKAFQPFIIGDFRTPGAELFDKMIYRTGNIFIPGSRYAQLHRLLVPLHLRLGYERRKESNPTVGITEYVHELGHQLELLQVPQRHESFVYWAWKHRIPIHCPTLLDGAIGDGLYAFRRLTKYRFGIDATEYLDQLSDDMILMAHERGDVAIWAIGGSVPKHMICNSAIFCGGARYAVYVNTASEADGSNAGASVDEAVSWGKIHVEASSVKIEGEATLVVPLMVAGVFQEYTPGSRASRVTPETAIPEMQPVVGAQAPVTAT